MSIMPVGFRVAPGPVTCMICNSAVASSMDDVPHCGMCGSRYCSTCLANRNPELPCAGETETCPLELSAPAT